MAPRYLSFWEQILGQEITNVWRNGSSCISLYFGDLAAQLEIESTGDGDAINFQEAMPMGPDPSWLEDRFVEGKRVIGVLVPFTAPGILFDARVLFRFSDGSEVYLASEVPTIPLRIT